MPNYLNKPISSGFRNTYTSQFVPLPLEQFARTNELNQAKQDAEVNTLNVTSNAGHKISGVAKEDNDYVASQLALFDDASSQLAKKDLTQRENQDLAKGLVKGLSRDKDLQTIMSNKSKYDEYVKNKEDSIKAGTYHPANDNGDITLRDYLKSGGYKSGKTIDPTIYKYEDARPIQEQYFNNLRELGADQVGKIGETFYKYGYDGISEGRISKQATEAIKSYMSTPAAMQEGRVYDLGVRQGTINPKKVSKNSYIFDNFLNAGMERAGMSFKSGLSEAKNSEAKTKKEEENVFANILNTETPSTLANGRPIKFKEDGSIDGSGQGFVDAFKKHGFSLKTISSWWNDDSLNEDEAKDAKFITTGAKLNGVTPAQYAQVYNNTSHMKVEKPLIGKALRDNTQVLFNGGAGIWSHLNVMNTTTGERNMNFASALEKVADEKGIPFVDPNKDPEGFSKMMKDLGVSITGVANPNEFSLKPVIFTVGNNSFAADMTFGGKQLPFKTQAENQKALDTANLDRLEKGQQILEKDSKGNDVIYFKDIKTGQIKHKLAKDLK